jgi:ABC-type antimicrobial peptide transport system permease subunit
MKVCKKAIINVKNELPNYKEIIKKINLEFDIPESTISNLDNNNNDNMNIYINNIVPNENNQSTIQNNDSSIQNNQQSTVFTKGNSSIAETGYNSIIDKNKSQM